MSATPTVTATSLITDAHDALGIYAVGETLSPSDLKTGLRKLNAMISAWNIQRLTIPAQTRAIGTITANISSYTVGTGGAFDFDRPADIERASLLLASASPNQEIPLWKLTEQDYALLPNKGQTSTQFTAFFYNPVFSESGFATVHIWPIPTTGDNSIVLYYYKPLAQFADLTTSYNIAMGAEEPLVYNLALRLGPPHGVKVSDDVRLLARQSLATYKRNNIKMSDLWNDMARINRPRWGYNIETDQ